jgi:hypothetical protein
VGDAQDLGQASPSGIGVDIARLRHAVKQNFYQFATGIPHAIGLLVSFI